MPVIDVWADVTCPFTHVGLRRLVDLRSALGRDDVRLRLRAWPLEIVNGAPVDAGFIDDEIIQIRDQVAPDLFGGFAASAFPATSLPALALASAAYGVDVATGETVSLALRDLLFEKEQNIADRAVLDAVAADHGVTYDPDDTSAVLAEYEAGKARGVIGSPHFFTADADFFCPALAVRHDDDGHLVVTPDAERFEAFTRSCFG